MNLRLLAPEVMLRLSFRAVSEYGLEALGSAANLILLPSAQNLDDSAMEQLIAFIEHTRAVLVVTGALGLNSYWQPSGRLEEFSVCVS
ncbi:hypothetical protein [Paenibacillus sp. HW567]|uniref:hypothetical protein n=1 Tax=Paenibacillus sp. HW567 TaxID=1034769 RepID=UPI0004919FCB|nr:hypothetical protein [Paenibacillus sp. HW567]